MLSDVFIAIAIAEIALAAPLLIRLGIGPSICDRVVALNTISTQATLTLLFFAAFAQRTIYLDVGVWLSSFSYLGTLIWARYLERGLL